MRHGWPPRDISRKICFMNDRSAQTKYHYVPYHFFVEDTYPKEIEVIQKKFSRLPELFVPETATVATFLSIYCPKLECLRISDFVHCGEKLQSKQPKLLHLETWKDLLVSQLSESCPSLTALVVNDNHTSEVEITMISFS